MYIVGGREQEITKVESILLVRTRPIFPFKFCFVYFARTGVANNGQFRVLDTGQALGSTAEILSLI